MGGDNVPYDWSIPIRRKDGRLVRATSAIPVKKVDADLEIEKQLVANMELDFGRRCLAFYRVTMYSLESRYPAIYENLTKVFPEPRRRFNRI